MVKLLHFFIIPCSLMLKRMIKKRANQLGLSIPAYLKYLALKDIEENDLEEIELKKHGKTKYPIY